MNRRYSSPRTTSTEPSSLSFEQVPLQSLFGNYLRRNILNSRDTGMDVESLYRWVSSTGLLQGSFDNASSLLLQANAWTGSLHGISKFLVETILSFCLWTLRLASLVPPQVLVALVAYVALTTFWRLLRTTLRQTFRLFKFLFQISLVVCLVGVALRLTQAPT